VTETHCPPQSPERWAALLAAEIDRRAAPRADFDLRDLETLIRAAEERTRPRTQLPSQFNRFPFTCGPFRQLLLTFYKRLFHDQRAVNTVLIQALRQTLAVNRHLLHEVAALRGPRAAGGDEP
jgi:hypothetical protein